MRSLNQSAREQDLRIALLAALLASLCFSVGEGLRLLPFHSSAPLINERADSHPSISPGGFPLIQFRTGKREPEPPGAPPLSFLPQLSTGLPGRSRAAEGMNLYLGPTSSLPQGRAPPQVA